MANLQVYIVSFGILLILLMRTIVDNERHFLQHFLFLGMIFGTMLSMALEAVTWLVDGMPGEKMRLVIIGTNVALYIFNLTPLILWVLYLEYQISKSGPRFDGTRKVLIGLFLLNGGLAFLSGFRNVYFFVDENNVYHRGSLNWITVALYFGLLVYAVLLPIFQRQVIPLRLRLPLILFSVPSVLGVVLQMLFYGLALAWGGVALSLLIIYTSVQNQILSIDYLTGLYNRRQLDTYLYQRTKSIHPNKTLAVLMIDIDRFKEINDSFGHQVGDLAIESTASVLRKVFHHEDFIARFAGDEFVVVLTLGQKKDLDAVLDRLEAQFQQFNQSTDQPFRLKISVGSVVYDPSRHRKADELLKDADQAMYRVKSSVQFRS